MEFTRITIDPQICHGKPAIRGMRITVASILELLAGGMTTEEILADYPYLEAGDISESLQFAARLATFKQYSIGNAPA